MRIYIPSCGRPDSQLTFRSLPEFWKRKAKIVVYPDEADKYKQQNLPVLVYPGSVRGISKKRAWIFKRHLRKSVDPYFVLMDDDLRFDKRRSDDRRYAIVATEQEIGQMLDLLEQTLKEGYAHAGVLTRERANNFWDRKFLYCSRMVRVSAYNASVLAREGIRFGRIQFMSDFDVTLQLLRKGYRNIVLCDYWQGHPGSNVKGGCSSYRTLEELAKSAHRLSLLHKGFVQVKERQTKGSWGGGKRTDVTIAWKKAFTLRRFPRTFRFSRRRDDE